MPGQNGLHLRRLHPEAADLHLVVDAPDEVDLAVGGPACEVPGPVHPFAGSGERVGDEALRRQVRAAQVAPRHPRAGDVQLTRGPGGDRPQTLVEDVGAHVLHREADRYARPRLVGCAHGRAGGEQRRLGRPVHRPYNDVGTHLQHPLDRRRGDHVTARHHLAHSGETPRILLRHDAEQSRGQVDARDLLLAEEAAQGGDVELVGRRHGDPAAVQQRHPQLEGRHAEGVGGHHQHAPVPFVVPARVQGQAQGVPVGDGDTLGRPRRP